MTMINSYSTHSSLRRSGLLNRRSDQRGQSAVEIALLLPLLLLLLSGIIITAFIFYASIQVTNAVREGARAGSVYRMTMASTGWTMDQTVQNAVYNPTTTPKQTALGFLNATPPSFNVATDVVIVSYLHADGTAGDKANPQAGDRLTLQVTYRYTVPVVSAALPMFPQPITFSPRVTMELQ